MERKFNPLVSIIILCYNHGKYLDQTISSVISQTYYNLEIIIVDNFSTDDSDEIIKKYLKIDNRISYIPVEINSYASCGINTGIKKCLGEYINILSGDDYFNIDKIELQLKFMAANNILNSFCWVNIIDDNGFFIEGHWADKLFNNSLTPNEVQKYFATNGNTLCASSAMLHRSVFEQIGLLDHRLLQLQDFEFWLRLVKNYKINILHSKLVYYRIRDDGKNLSMATSGATERRTWFELFICTKHILDFDLTILSEISGVCCNNDNKLINMYNYYKKSNNIPCAGSLLLSMYERLDLHFNFPSKNYDEFLDAYSNFDFFGVDEKRKVYHYCQVTFPARGSIYPERSLKFPVLESSEYQYFLFDIECNDEVVDLFFFPFNDKCVIEIKNINLIMGNKEINLLPYLKANCCSKSSNILYFDTIDPMISFKNLKIKYSHSNHFFVCVKYLYTGNSALEACINLLKQKNKKNFLVKAVRYMLRNLKGGASE